MSGVGTAVSNSSFEDGRNPNTAAAFADPALDPYEFIGLIGSGGLGAVYKVRHRGLDRYYAIKILHSHVATADNLQRFQREARALASLQHPGIIAVHDISVTQNNQPFMVMDYVAGDDLNTFLKRNSQLPIAELLDIFIQLTEAFQHAHEKGVIHRDIKPSNIKILPGNANDTHEVRVLDFGLAKTLSTESGAPSVTKTGDIFGTPLYMSPEQCKGQQTDERSDIYSLGCMMFEMLTGVPPFDGPNTLQVMLQQIDEEPPTLRSATLGKSFPSALERLISRTLQKNPDARYQSMASLKADLIKLREGSNEVGTIPASAAAPPKATVSPAAPTVLSKALNDKPIMLLVGCSSLLIALAIPVTWFMTRSAAPNQKAAVEKAPDLSQRDRERYIRDKLALDPKHLDLSYAPIHEGDLAQLDGKELESLDLSYSAITDKELPAIGKLNSLGSLNLSNTAIKSLSGLRSLKLKTLLVDHTQVDDDSLKNIDTILLEKLELVKTQVRTLQSLKSACVLHDLNLNDTKIESSAVDVLVRLPSLENLSLDRTLLKDSDYARLIESHDLAAVSMDDCPNLSNATKRKTAAALSRSDLKVTEPSAVYNAFKDAEAKFKAGQLESSAREFEDAAAEMMKHQRSFKYEAIGEANFVAGAARTKLKQYALAIKDLSRSIDCYERLPSLQQVRDSYLPGLAFLGMCYSKIGDQRTADLVVVKYRAMHQKLGGKDYLLDIQKFF